MTRHSTRVALLAATALVALPSLPFSSAAAQTAAAPSSSINNVDLRQGAVFTMSNDRKGNRVIAFFRQSDGTLRRVGSFATGGTGSGSFEDSANGMVLGTPQGEASPNNHIEQATHLFVTNAGSDNISVFRVQQAGLSLVGVYPSGGQKPVSVTVNRGLLYVLNSGEPQDDLLDSAGNVIPNCTTETPSIAGFRVAASGALTPIPGSERRLSQRSESGCAQISFTPDGTVLVATERLAMDGGPAGPVGDEGVIVTFTRGADGLLTQAGVFNATGSGPFGFTFSKPGQLFTTEQFDGILGPGMGAAASYRVASSGVLSPTSGSVRNMGTDTCWFVVTDNGRYGYATSFFGGGRISIYRTDAGLGLLVADASPAVTEGAADLALSRNSEFLYQLNAFEGTVNAFRIAANGGLTHIQTVRATPPNKMAARLGLAAF